MVEAWASDGEELSITLFLVVRQPLQLRLGKVMERAEQQTLPRGETLSFTEAGLRVERISATHSA